MAKVNITTVTPEPVITRSLELDKDEINLLYSLLYLAEVHHSDSDFGRSSKAGAYYSRRSDLMAALEKLNDGAYPTIVLRGADRYSTSVDVYVVPNDTHPEGVN